MAQKSPKISDAGLAYVAGCEGLETLILNANDISDKGLMQLKTLTKLQTLTVGDTLVTDSGIPPAALVFPRIPVLVLSLLHPIGLS